MILAGDIGGTKARLALFEPGSGRAEPAASACLPSAGHDSLESVLDLFLDLHPAKIEAAAFGVAGPVVDGRSRITNLPWIVRQTSLADRLGTPRVRLVNDLAALAVGLPLLRDSEIEVIQVYLPAQLDEAEVGRIVKAKVEELGVTSKKELGKVMKAVMAEHKGAVDGKLVQRLAAELVAE